MAVKVIVNPNDPDGENQTVLFHDRQVILDVDLQWSDGMIGHMTVYINGEQVGKDKVSKNVHVNLSDPEPME